MWDLRVCFGERWREFVWEGVECLDGRRRELEWKEGPILERCKKRKSSNLALGTGRPGRKLFVPIVANCRSCLVREVEIGGPNLSRRMAGQSQTQAEP